YWEKAELPDPMTDRSSRYVVIGCGTSYNLALSIAAILNSKGYDAIAVPAGEWLSRPNSYTDRQPSDLKVIALSRSGETTETVNAAAASRQRGSEVIGLTCASPSGLADNSDRTLYFETHPEEGIVMTSSASLMLMAGMALAGVPFAPGFQEPAAALLEQFAKAKLGA
ncbi:MAG: SIS domain-containing protein, partial [bacterium]|nr:SIS domain-containing protein [bacterium]